MPCSQRLHPDWPCVPVPYSTLGYLDQLDETGEADRWWDTLLARYPDSAQRPPK